MTKETDLRDVIADLLAADHRVRATITDTTMKVDSALIDSATPADNVHTIQVSTTSEAIINAIASAVATTGLP